METERIQTPERQKPPGTEILRLARDSIEYGLIHREAIPIKRGDVPPALMEPGATFTTLRLDGQLRGCCGRLEASRPLAEDVTHSAFQAAFRDPRFGPVREAELGAIQLEVSVLSPLEPIKVTDEADLLGRLRPGTDGLVIVDGARRATFLPKVWDALPDPREFLAALKLKCGLTPDHWSGQLEFQRYRTMDYAETR